MERNLIDCRLQFTVFGLKQNQQTVMSSERVPQGGVVYIRMVPNIQLHSTFH